MATQENCQLRGRVVVKATPLPLQEDQAAVGGGGGGGGE